MVDYAGDLIKSFNDGYRTARDEVNYITHIEAENLSVGGLLDITEDPAGWYKIKLGDDYLYFDTVTGKDGKEHFNLIELTEDGETEQLMTEKEWREL